MRTGELTLPAGLVSLLESGWWPRTYDEAGKQNTFPLIASEVVTRVFPEHSGIHFFPPPFVPFSEVVEKQPGFWLDPALSLHEIDPCKAIDIGDFGIGSDSSILLDYRKSVREPTVLYLRYEEGEYEHEAHWVQCAKSFGELIRRLGVET